MDASSSPSSNSSAEEDDYKHILGYIIKKAKHVAEDKMVVPYVNFKETMENTTPSKQVVQESSKNVVALKSPLSPVYKNLDKLGSADSWQHKCQSNRDKIPVTNIEHVHMNEDVVKTEVASEGCEFLKETSTSLTQEKSTQIDKSSLLEKNMFDSLNQTEGSRASLVHRVQSESNMTIKPKKSVSIIDANDVRLSKVGERSPSKVSRQESTFTSASFNDNSRNKEVDLRAYTENEIKETFRLIDIKGNNFLSKEDIISVFNTMGIELSIEDCRIITQEMSSSADEIINYEDFSAIMYNEYEHGVTDEDLRFLFDIIDVDNDGYLEPSDIQLLFKKCGAKLSIPETAEVIASYDDDFDGILSFQEFRKLFNDKIKDRGVMPEGE